jgi:hypothetical protein
LSEGWKLKSKSAKVFTTGKREAHRRLETALIAEGDLRPEQRLDRIRRGALARVHRGEDGVEGLERAGHLEVGQLGPEPIPAGEWRGLHGAPPVSWA